eukprot:CAMPEP_0206248108 /NCGR_PEP_ID=MMETSP0047_2-20121206/20187_1 /ASSEMBLY_ACC=CAM_ASM_000192 /TAXON_ID=195065 /ORGANISM="Chroomonas mesostigmatica_cf, Strain CCMP1168" /LENGTH=222 /DNA_ID=CAMNT_0053673717 /DNA_START=335 /DNA_END=1004 /DNA_ORIENTATION=+
MPPPHTHGLIGPNGAELNVVVLELGHDIVCRELQALVRLAPARRLGPGGARALVVPRAHGGAVARAVGARLPRGDAPFVDLPDLPVNRPKIRRVPKPRLARLALCSLALPQVRLQPARGVLRGTGPRRLQQVGDIEVGLITQHGLLTLSILNGFVQQPPCIRSVRVRVLVIQLEAVVKRLRLQRLARRLIPAVGRDRGRIKIRLLVLASPIRPLYIIPVDPR